MEKLRIFCFSFVLYSLSGKKKAGLAWAYIVLRRIQTVFMKIIKLSTVFPNIPFVESGPWDFMFVLNQPRRHLTNQGVWFFSRVKFLLGLCIYATVSKLWEAIAQRFMQTKKIG